MDYPENRPQPNGLTAEGEKLFATAFSSAASKDHDWWKRAEDLAAELIASIQPNPSSEKKRQAIVDFIQDLIKKCFDFTIQVETFGSVPLKTYLPDGDIDLTAVTVHTDLKDIWALDVVKALQVVEANADSQFRVKDVNYIQAEVKIIKCLVENIVVDISFNQTGGLCTFCFLEKVDRHIKRDHLFKKSIILVKAWCYYESRLLGAHHGLISTYALETLVLYIFHVFHSSLGGPLKVLFIFLAYFSNFDWDKFCVSLWGPVRLDGRISGDSALPPRKDRKDRECLLLTKDFIDEFVKEFSSVSTGLESNQGRPFNTKFLNVLDPIRDTNNLGRSVNVGSFKRIRSAFGLGARTLGEVLECSNDQINERFKSFFSCTFKSLDRYRIDGSRRLDTGNPVVHGVQHPSSGAGSANFHERSSGGYKQEKGTDTRHSPRTTTYSGENARSQFSYNYSWPGLFDPRPMDTPEMPNEIQNDSAMWSMVAPTMADVPFSYSSGKDSGNTVNTVLSASNSKQARFRTTEPSLTQPFSSNLNDASSEEQWRQVGGKGWYTNPEGDTAGVQVKGSNYYTPQKNFDRSIPANCRSSEEHEHANYQLMVRNPMVSEYQARVPTQNLPRWGSSRVDFVGQGSGSRSRDVSDYHSLSNHDVGRPPGPPGDSKTSSNRNSNRKLSSGDENESSTSGRKTASSEESKTTFSKRVSHQRIYTSSGDISHQGNSPDSGNQNMLQPLPHSKPYLSFQHYPTHIYPPAMHLPVSTAIPVPASSSAGPPSASTLNSTYHSLSSGESFPSRTNPYVAMQSLPILPLAMPPTSPSMIPVASSGDSISSHIGGFRPHAEEQREYRRPSIEDQMQPLHRASFTSSASSGHSFPMGSPSLSEGYPNFVSVAPLVPPPFLLGKSKPVQGGPVRPTEIAYGPINENLSQLSISDERPGEASTRLEEGVDHPALRTRNRENRPNISDVKLSDGKHARGTKGAEQLSRSHSSSERSDMEVARSVDGHAADLRPRRTSQPPLEENSVRDMQSAIRPPFLSTVHTIEPTSVSIYGAHSGSFHPPIIEHGSVPIGLSFKNRPVETVSMPVTVPQRMLPYDPSLMYVMPRGADFRGDSVTGLHSNGSMDFITDIQGSQSLTDARLRIIPQGGMGVAERPKGTGGVISPSNKVETSNMERVSDEAGPSDLQDDILRGSSVDHKEGLLRSLMGSKSPNSVTSAPKSPQLPESSGRQKGNLNHHAGLNISQPPGGVSSSYPSRDQLADGTQQSRGFGSRSNDDIMPKSRAGTGAYLPRQYLNRDRSGSSGRGGNHGAYGQQDRNNLEGTNQPHAARYRSVGQGQGQQMHEHKPRAQIMMNSQTNLAPDLRDSSFPQQQQLVGKRGLPPLSLPPSHSSQPTSTGVYIVSSNGYPGTGTNAPPDLMQHSVNDGSAGLEFGSLGPVQSG